MNKIMKFSWFEETPTQSWVHTTFGGWWGLREASRSKRGKRLEAWGRDLLIKENKRMGGNSVGVFWGVSVGGNSTGSFRRDGTRFPFSCSYIMSIPPPFNSLGFESHHLHRAKIINNKSAIQTWGGPVFQLRVLKSWKAYVVSCFSPPC